MLGGIQNCLALGACSWSQCFCSAGGQDSRSSERGCGEAAVAGGDLGKWTVATCGHLYVEKFILALTALDLSEIH